MQKKEKRMIRQRFLYKVYQSIIMHARACIIILTITLAQNRSDCDHALVGVAPNEIIACNCSRTLWEGLSSKEPIITESVMQSPWLMIEIARGWYWGCGYYNDPLLTLWSRPDCWSPVRSYLEEVHSVSQSRERYLPRRLCYERSTCAAARFQRGGHLLSLSLEKDNKL